MDQILSGMYLFFLVFVMFLMGLASYHSHQRFEEHREFSKQQQEYWQSKIDGLNKTE